MRSPWLLVMAGVGCGSPQSPPVPVESAADCAKAMAERYEIDVSPEPRVCAPLRAAIAPLGPTSVKAIRGLAIVRAGRGRCGDKCPDLASMLMSDAALAFYQAGTHSLNVVDATFDGPRWLGGTPSPQAIQDYLRGLGLSWQQLVARVRALPGVTLPADLPDGSPLVFDAIVRRGPAIMLGSEISLEHLFRHELGHAVLLNGGGGSVRVSSWSSISGWSETSGDEADGYLGGFLQGEEPIVASRLVLGLPRGDGDYVLRGKAPTKYAGFDPVEDHAESLRLLHGDPVALGTISPARFLVIAAGEIDLRDPKLRRFIEPGVAALLATGADPLLAMATLRAHGEALLPEAARFADARPLEIPSTMHPEMRPTLEGLTVKIGKLQFRPTDAAYATLLARIERELREYEEFERGLPDLTK